MPTVVCFSQSFQEVLRTGWSSQHKEPALVFHDMEQLKQLQLFSLSLSTFLSSRRLCASFDTKRRIVHLPSISLNIPQFFLTCSDLPGRLKLDTGTFSMVCGFNCITDFEEFKLMLQDSLCLWRNAWSISVSKHSQSDAICSPIHSNIVSNYIHYIHTPFPKPWHPLLMTGSNSCRGQQAIIVSRSNLNCLATRTGCENQCSATSILLCKTSLCPYMSFLYSI